MNLLLRCVTPAAKLDVAVEADAATTLEELRAALVEHARGLGVVVPCDAPISVGSDAIQPASTILASGLTSGDTVGLGTEVCTGLTGQALRVSVIGGPDSGTVQIVGPGRHSVGRHPDADLALTDPAVEPSHMHLDVRSDRALRVVPVGAAAVSVAGVPVEGATPIADGTTIRVGSSALQVSLVRRRRGDVLGQLAHNRTPHNRVVIHDRVLDPVRRAPEAPSRPRSMAASALLPLLSGVMLVVLSGRVAFLLLAVMAPVMFLWGALRDRRSGRRRFERERRSHKKSVAARVQEARIALDDELVERRRAAPPLEQLVPHAVFLQARLWERDAGSPDFCEIRLGTGPTRSRVRGDVETGGDEDLERDAVQALAFHTSCLDAPISVELEEFPVVAVVGDRSDRHEVARAMIARAAILHSPEDLLIAAAVGSDCLVEHAWVKWLPHVRTSSSPLRAESLATWPDEVDALLAELATVAEERSSARSPGDGVKVPRVLLLLDEAVAGDRALLSRLLDRAGPTGVRVIWVGSDLGEVPRQSEVVIRCCPPELLSVVDWCDPTRAAVELLPDRLDLETASSVARCLAPVRDATSATQVASLPALVPLHDVIVTGRPGPAAIAATWEQPADGLAAPVGLDCEGVHLLDLVADGPHALVAGTSGAGKSEFLQAWVASMAVSHPPERLNFLLIDYKGGAFSGAFADLPHCVGAATNLDASLARRALISLRAELNRRMALLGGDAKDLEEFRRDDPERAPARLVIVVDEFATLVREIPDFVAGVVDLAQRGRSLGIHLVLATQRPQGALNDDILANTNLRISLRVLDPAESSSVVGVPDAAALPAPLRGRAFARSGPGRLDPFQSAFGGAADDPGDRREPVSVTAFDFSGSRCERSRGSVSAVAGGGMTQLSFTVEAVAEAHRITGRERPVAPWVEPLPELVTLDAFDGQGVVERKIADPGRWVTLGLADRPELQQQQPWTVDLEASGGMLVFGSGGTGRTTLLRSAATQLARQGDGDSIEMHVVDAASGGLGCLRVLPQVSSVATGELLEPVARLTEVLEAEIARRRVLLAEADSDSLSTFRDMRSVAVVPRVIVLVDGLIALREAFDSPEAHEWFTRLVRVFVDGRQFGVHVIATAERRSGLPAALVGSLGTRCLLRLSDSEEAFGMGVPRSMLLGVDAPPGRGVVDGTQIQIGVVAPDATGPGQAAAISGLGKCLRAVGTRPSRALPDLDVPGQGPMRSESQTRLVIGTTDLTGAEASVDLAEGHLLVVGPPRSGRSTALVGMAGALLAAGAKPRLVALGGPDSPLAEVGGFDACLFARHGHSDLLEQTASSLVPEAAGVELVLFIDSLEDCADPGVDRSLENLARIDTARLVCVSEAATVTRAFSGCLAELRRQCRVVMLAPEGRPEIESVIGRRVVLRPGQTFPPGRGLLALRGGVSLIQIFLNE